MMTHYFISECTGTHTVNHYYNTTTASSLFYCDCQLFDVHGTSNK